MLLLLALVLLLIYPLKQLNNARVCDERKDREFLSGKKESDDSIMGFYFQALCD